MISIGKICGNAIAPEPDIAHAAMLKNKAEPAALTVSRNSKLGKRSRIFVTLYSRAEPKLNISIETKNNAKRA
ncbi:hypothetical protein [Caballeronia sp. dw_276]|uniref:hypothetical protein n=1 Tax=Caballeronia sp. dw_276 TaxID=2719795 RepID=UPI001BD31E88|nr:hypothetical protein [Caballeronia sp. dw_276]